MYVLLGPATTPWARFAKRLVDGHRLKPATSTHGLGDALLIPAELAPTELPTCGVVLYVNRNICLETLPPTLMAYMDNRVVVIAETVEVSNAWERLTGCTATHVIPMDSTDSRWETVLRVTREEVEDHTSQPSGIVELAVYESPGVPAIARTSLLRSREGSVAYVANASYQMEHLIPILERIPGTVLLPRKQFRVFNELPSLRQTPSLPYGCAVTEVGYPGGLCRSIRGKFVVTTGVFKQLTSSDYPRSLFVCHGISDKLAYHSTAARANFTYYASSGPRFTAMYMQHGIPDNRIVKCGYIRNSIPCAAYPEFDILYAPTHHAGTIEPYVRNIIKTCQEKGLRLKIRLHPLTENLMTMGISSLIETYVAPGSVSTWSLLKAARFVITDISSISYEAVLLDKDVLLLNGSSAWTRLENLPSGKFGIVMSPSDSSRMSGYIDKLINGASKLRIAKSDIFYIDRDPQQIVVDFVQSQL